MPEAANSLTTETLKALSGHDTYYVLFSFNYWWLALALIVLISSFGIWRYTATNPSPKPYPKPLRGAIIGAYWLAVLLLCVMIPRIGHVSDRETAAQPALWLDLGKNLAAIVGGLVAVFALFYTHRRHQQTDKQLDKTAEQLELTRQQLRITEQGNLTERFTRAVELLGTMREERQGDETHTKPNLEVRLGGIYSLERLAKDSPEDRPQIVELLCAYVRENAPINCSRPDDVCNIRNDVYAVISVLDRMPRKVSENEKEPFLDLRYADLRAADFRGKKFKYPKMFAETNLHNANFSYAQLGDAYFRRAYLANAIFEHAQLNNADFGWAKLNKAAFGWSDLNDAEFALTHLEDASFTCARLDRAHFTQASLQRADFSHASLAGASFRNADLHDVDFEDSNLTGAHFESADLRDAKGLTQGQIDSALGNEHTRLPANVVRPDHWK